MHRGLMWSGAGIAALLALTACDASGETTTRTESEVDAPSVRPSPSAPATPLPKSGSLAPGTYAISKPQGSVADYRWLVVAMPAGWATSDGLVHKRLGEPGEVTFSGWTVQGIYDDPCRWQESRLSDLDLRDDRVHENFHDVAIGSTVPKPRQGGLANQTGRNASALTSVSFGGVPTLKIELSVPADLDLGTCDQGEFRSWNGWRAAASINAHHAPGQVDVVYMVDLDRAPLVIDASHRPAASESDLAELEAILGSMVVDRGP